MRASKSTCMVPRDIKGYHRKNKCDEITKFNIANSFAILKSPLQNFKTTMSTSKTNLNIFCISDGFLFNEHKIKQFAS